MMTNKHFHLYMLAARYEQAAAQDRDLDEAATALHKETLAMFNDLIFDEDALQRFEGEGGRVCAA